MSAQLKAKIQKNKARIAVVGLGYVGLPLAISFAEKGFSVEGIDKDDRRVNNINKKKTYITDISSKELANVVNKKDLWATTNFHDLTEADVILICVPTPLKNKYTPDISYILSAVKSICKYMKKHTLIVLESTTYPGTTEELIKPELEKGGFKVGKDFFLSFSPERIDPGNTSYSVKTIPKLVGGVTKKCGELTQLLYEKVIKKVHLVTSPRAAEMTKLYENSFRIVNIGWINEVAQMCHHFDIDVWEVIEAAKTKPFGFMPFYPGLGVGGHCIPDDPLYLHWKAKRYGFNPKFIKLSSDINSSMPAYATKRLTEILRSQKKTLKTAKILVVGITYKKDVNDMRKSPSVKLISAIKKKGIKVDYYDPIVSSFNIDGLEMESIKWSIKDIKSYDCVVAAVDHTKVKWTSLLKNAKHVFDVRNIYKKANVKVTKL